MLNDYEKDADGMEESLKGYVKWLQEILTEANTGEFLEGALLYLVKVADPRDFKEVIGYDVYVRSYVQAVEGVLVNGVAQDKKAGEIPFKLRKGRTKTVALEDTVQYLHVYDESAEGAKCVYIKRKAQESEAPFLEQTGKKWHEAKADITFGQTIVNHFLQVTVPPDIGRNRKYPHYSQSQKRLSAGKLFAAALLKKKSGKDGNEIYENLNLVSALAYESQQNYGSMAIMSGDGLDNVKAKMKITFQKPVDITCHKGVRKLFEIASQEFCLVCDGEKIHGLMQQGSLAEKCHDKYLRIQMNGHLKWEILEPSAAGEETPRIAFNGTNFTLNTVSGDNKMLENIQEKLREMLRNGAEENLGCSRCDYNRECGAAAAAENREGTVETWSGRMKSVLTAATKQSHGTTIVFSRFAEKEAERLNKTSFQIKPELLEDPEIIQRITAIDGAVLYDFEGNCHAIGVILDGKTGKKPEDKNAAPQKEGNGALQETIERGARFNSAIRYKYAFPCSVICVVSEDGYVNLV